MSGFLKYLKYLLPDVLVSLATTFIRIICMYDIARHAICWIHKTVFCQVWRIKDVQSIWYPYLSYAEKNRPFMITPSLNPFCNQSDCRHVFCSPLLRFRSADVQHSISFQKTSQDWSLYRNVISNPSEILAAQSIVWYFYQTAILFDMACSSYVLQN